MKKTLWSLSFVFYACFGFGQVVDTAAVIQDVDSLLKLANKLMRGSPDEAMKLATTANQKTEAVLGQDNLSYADCQHQIGAIYNEMRKPALAEQPLKTGLEIRLNKLGPDNIACSTSYNSLGTSNALLKKYAEAEQYFVEAKRINAKHYGVKHFNYVMGAQNLAAVYRNTARNEEAEKIFREALAVLKDTLGDAHPLYAMVSMNLGLSLYERGAYGEAEAVMTTAKQSFEKMTSRNDKQYFVLIQNLALLYNVMGRYETALQQCREGKEISQKAFGENHFTAGEIATTAGLCYKSLGDLSKSEKELQLSRDLMLKAFGTTNQRYAQSLINLALLYYAQKKYEAALTMFEEAEQSYRASSMDNTQDFATLKIGKGRNFLSMGDYDRAETDFLAALDLMNSNSSENVDEYKMVVHELAKLYHRSGAFEKAEEYALTFARVMQQNLEMAARYFSEQDMLAYQALYKMELNHFFSLSVQYSSEKLNQSVYNLAMLTKNFLLEGKLNLQKILAKADEQTKGVYHQWLGLQRRLAREYLKPVAKQTERGALEKAANDLEQQLTRQMAGFGETYREITWQEVQAALQPGEAALEFIHFNYYRPDRTDSILYAAVLLKPGMRQPLFLPLFEEKQLMALLPGGGGKLNTDQVNALYGSRKLYDLIWSPLDAQLQGVRKVYCVPGGLLHRLSLSALPDGTNTVLADRYDLVTLGSTRHLVTGLAREKNTASTALVYGGIQFEPGNQPAPGTPANGGGRGLDFSAVDSTMRSAAWYTVAGWPPLKYSEKEATNVQRIFAKAGYQSNMLKGAQATEESFKKIGQQGPSPRMLHISTHGFFFPDPKEELNPGTGFSGDQPVFKLSEHPMIRSGLVLAGCNEAWKTGKAPANREDGVLTAYEISQLDLRNTELVVLSACETGLGQIEGNEGVYGLQRAFKIAGVKNLVMSLWAVPDHQTEELMGHFYEKLLIEKLPVRQALRAAQQEMRRQRYEPYYWAGFVVVE